MKTYARIFNSTVVELFSTDGNMAEMFHPDLLWVDITEITPVPQIDWTAHFGTLGWVFDVPEELAPDSTLKTLAKKWLTGIGRQP
ncbi:MULTISPECIES: hypothetical protein [unclassified Pseudomonas]|jgi:hypothetical protein|uniref:hypothetical protein n=1 Tax=unclassified Pseudomonas TaxID=196821 RepID=UPI00027005A0|nr:MULTISPECIES: hypothetical protein [unclassified Pseudomonas]EJM07740.1 hypothetical protein PMI19_00353 [Pseudomonas sp. GM16]EJM44658.1 hypothetical protein PMI23_00833 [Pseudomonas sp. GM24]